MEKVKKYSPAIVLLLLCIMCGNDDVADTDLSLKNMALYHFTHANIFHFLANALVLARICPRWTIIPVAYLSASVAAICVFFGIHCSVCGMSGIIFAIIAEKDARKSAPDFRLLAINSISGLIPGICWEIHLLSYLISFTIWSALSKTRKK